MSAAAPRLPSRRQDPEEVGTDDPPPAYQAVPNPSQAEETLAYGPLRPFQPPPSLPPRQYAPPAAPPPSVQSPQSTGASLSPPSFPFWNGSHLTPQQTGFSEGPAQQAYEYGGPQQPLYGPGPGQAPFQQAYSPPPQQFSPPPQQHSFSPPLGSPPGPPLPPRPAAPTTYAPSITPIPGQPLLNKGRILVFPPTLAQCPKCSNTGYKFNDPTHPCRKCWEKFGKPWNGALKLSFAANDPPPNFQRPLRIFAPPQPQAPRPPPPQIMHSNMRPVMGGNTLVVRPGDPRIGGELCRKCGGAGFTVGFFGDDQCRVCRGSGRVF